MPSHDPEIYKDKIEVSLDGRQIFYLFFGGSVIVGLVFVLGVMVGRRVEARGHLDRADTQAASDPLAALDRLEGSDHLSFRGALTGAQTPTEVEKAIGELERRRAAGQAAKPDKPAAAAPAPRPDKPEPAASSTSGEARAARSEDKPDPAARTEPVDRPRVDKHDGDKRDGDRKARKHDDGGSDAKKSASRGESSTRPEGHEAHDGHDGHDGHVDAKNPAEQADAKPRGRFTLQLSSFQDKSEAEAFLSAMKSAGFQPYLTEADVTGKGTFYRVRLGSYRSLEAANDAKAEFEKAARKSAQIMRL